MRWRDAWIRPGLHHDLALVAMAAWALSLWLPPLPSPDPAVLRAKLTPAWRDRFVAGLRDRGHSPGYISRTLSTGRAAPRSSSP
mgnify:CR=1 FL=1